MAVIIRKTTLSRTTRALLTNMALANASNLDRKARLSVVIYQPLELKITPKIGLLSTKQMPKTLLKKVHNKFEKIKQRFLTRKMIKNDPPKCQKWFKI